MATEDRLVNMKQTIETKREERSMAEGKKQQLLDQLMRDFEVSSVDEAKALIERLESEIGETDKKLKELVDKIEAEYEQLR